MFKTLVKTSNNLTLKRFRSTAPSSVDKHRSPLNFLEKVLESSGKVLEFHIQLTVATLSELCLMIASGVVDGFDKCANCLCTCTQQGKLTSLPDEELILLVESRSLPGHQLEKVLEDPLRAVHIR